MEIINSKDNQEERESILRDRNNQKAIKTSVSKASSNSDIIYIYEEVQRYYQNLNLTKNLGCTQWYGKDIDISMVIISC